MPSPTDPDVRSGGPATYREALRALRAAQKPAGRGAPAYSLYVNRRAGRYLAALAYRLGWSPNTVTLISAAFTFTAIALIAAVPSSLLAGVAVTALLAVGYALDSADGQVARLRGGGSAAGEWLDHVVDAAKTATLHAAVVIAAYRFLVPVDRRVLLLVPIVFGAVACTSFAVFLLNDLLRAARLQRSTTSVIRQGSSPLRALSGLPTDYGVLVYVFLLLGAPAAFLTVYSLLMLANLGYLVLALPKWFRDMRALEHPHPNVRTQESPA